MKRDTKYSLPLLCACFLIAGCNNPVAIKGLPGAGPGDMPIVAYSELHDPVLPVVHWPRAALAVLNDHDFALLAGDSVMYGPGIVEGEIESVGEQEITLLTGGDKVRLLYAIPGVKMLPVKPGEIMSISWKHGSGEHLTEFQMTGGVNGRLLYASGRHNSAGPAHIMLQEGVELVQIAKPGKPDTMGNIVVAPIQVALKTTAGLLPVGAGMPAVEVNGAKYKVLILHSIDTRPVPGHEAQSEGQGYWLEYAIVRQ